MDIDEAAVPGTVRVVDAAHELRGLRERGDIILVPQPTADAEDPLNWAPWRKRRAMYLAHLYTFTIAWASSAVYSTLVPISAATGLSVATLNRGSGTMLLFFGWGALLFQPLALCFGRRGALLVSLLGTVAVSAWTAHAPSYAAWVSSRVLLGLVGAPIEVAPEMIVTDLFFHHERGRHVGVYMLSLTGGSYLCSVFSGLIDQTMGWQWVMYWCALLNALSFVLLFFGFEETLYRRNTGFEASRGDGGVVTEVAPGAVVTEADPAGASPSPSTPDVEKTNTTTATTPATTPVFPPPRPYWQKLAPFRVEPGRAAHFLAYAYRPLQHYWTYPLVLWASVYHGIAVVCFNALNATASVVLSAPPYRFGSTAVGLAYLGPAVGAVAGGVWSGWVNDGICLWLARRNRAGLREAEHRLYAAAVLCVVPPVGFVVWGVGAASGVHWVGLIVGMGLLGFALTAGGGLMITYVTDSYKELQGSTMVSLNVMRCTMAFGFGYAVDPWLAATGTRDTFVTWCLLSAALFATFAPVIVWGKRLRARSAAAYWREVRATAGLYH